MKNRTILNSLIIGVFVTILGSCGSSKKTTYTPAETRKADSMTAISLIDSLNIMAKADSIASVYIRANSDTAKRIAFENYRASATIINQLIHTELHVSFDYAKQYLFGKATITLKPYFCPTDSLTLDAKGMDIH